MTRLVDPFNFTKFDRTDAELEAMILFSIMVANKRADHTNKIGHIARPVQLVMEPHKQGEPILEPTLHMSAQDATNLMNALWQAGVRPSDFKSPNGEINRIQAHLDDMRKLVFVTDAAPLRKEGE